MKRFAVPFLAALSLLVPLVADAGQWVQKEIFWRKSSHGGPQGTSAIWVRDTTYTVLAGEVADTTGDFSINAADLWRPTKVGTATYVDTALVAFIVLQADSSVRGTESITSVTAEIDGKAFSGGPTINLDNYQQIDSLAVTFPDFDLRNRVITVPIRAVNGLGGLQPGGNGPENFLQMPYRIHAYQTLRVRFSTAAGILSGGVRAFVRYWDEEVD